MEHKFFLPLSFLCIIITKWMCMPIGGIKKQWFRRYLDCYIKGKDGTYEESWVLDERQGLPGAERDNARRGQRFVSYIW